MRAVHGDFTRLRLETEMANLPDDTRNNMISDLEQMENIVDQFLAYARRSPNEQVPVNFSDALSAAMSNARIKSDPTIEATFSADPDLWVMAHPLELSRAIQNLITNAMRYGRSDDGQLRISLGVHRSEDGRDAVLEVADQGKGLPAAERERVMRPFERGEAARSGVTGSGLGLAIVDRIVRRSGGSVELGDASPHGLLVRVRFPLAPKAELKKSMKAQEKAARETER